MEEYGFPHIGISNGIDFYNFGIRYLQFWYKERYRSSRFLSKISVFRILYSKNWYKVGSTFSKNWYKERVCL